MTSSFNSEFPPSSCDGGTRDIFSRLRYLYQVAILFFTVVVIFFYRVFRLGYVLDRLELSFQNYILSDSLETAPMLALQRRFFRQDGRGAGRQGGSRSLRAENIRRQISRSGSNLSSALAAGSGWFARTLVVSTADFVGGTEL